MAGKLGTVVDPHSVRQRILRLLADTPRPMTSRDIADVLTVPHPAVTRTLSNLRWHGITKRQPAVLWALAGRTFEEWDA